MGPLHSILEGRPVSKLRLCLCPFCFVGSLYLAIVSNPSMFPGLSHISGQCMYVERRMKILGWWLKGSCFSCILVLITPLELLNHPLLSYQNAVGVNLK